MTLAVCWSEQFAIHDSGRAGLYLPVGGLIEDDVHVDSTARITRTRNLLRTSGIDEAATILEPRKARVEEVLRVHSEEHVARMQEVSEAGEGDAGGGYTPMDAHSYGLALLSAGSALTALETVVAGGRTAHALLRRSGHHAWRDSGYGFCVFNNCAIVARTALDELSFERVAVVDIDAHHGNGTEAIFYGSSQVLYSSIHQSPLYPGTGAATDSGSGEGEGYTVNLPVPPGSGPDEFLSLVQEVVVPVGRQWAPELICISAGYDAHSDDPLANCSLDDAAYGDMAGTVRDVAVELEAPVLICLEGGYSLGALSRSVVATLEAFSAERAPRSAPIEPAAPHRERLARFWPALDGTG